jgi:hypothetical protein
MSDEPLMDAIVQMILFLELSDHDIVNEDAAVSLMEQIAVTLQRLDANAVDRFLRYVKLRAIQTESQAERKVLDGLGMNFGLTSE